MPAERRLREEWETARPKLMDAMDEIVVQRDVARAEVERLREAVTQAHNALERWRTDWDDEQYVMDACVILAVALSRIESS